LLNENSEGAKAETRSLRMSSALAAKLKEEADEKKVSFNSFVVSILEDYVDRRRLASSFDFVTLSDQAFTRLVNSVGEEEIVNIGKHFGAIIPKEVIMFGFKELNLDSFISYLRFANDYQKLFHIEVEREEDEKKLVIIAKHERGVTYSKWVEAYISAAIRECLPSIRFEVETFKELIKFTLFLEPKFTY